MENHLPCDCKVSMDSGFSYQQPVQQEKETHLVVEEIVRPTNGLTGNPLEFVIQVKDFVVLNSITAHVKHAVIKSNKADRADADPRVAPINNAGPCAWRAIKTRINDHEINQSSAFHPGIKSYTSIVLSYNPTPAKQLKAGGFTHSAAVGEHMNAVDDTNAAFKTRAETYKKDVTVSYAVPVDICAADNFLAPFTKLTFEFYPADPEFYLMAANTSITWQMHIKDMYLQYRRVALAPATMEKVLSPGYSAPRRYLMPYTELKTVELPPGVTRWSVPIYSAGSPLPRQMVVMQVPTANMFDLTKTPLAFPHLNINYIAPRINDEIALRTAAEPDFAKGLLSKDYYRLFQHTGKAGSTTQGPLISMEQFANNFAIFPFDLTVDRCNGRHVHMPRTAKLELIVGWNVALQASTTLLIYNVFDQILYVDPATGKPTVQLL